MPRRFAPNSSIGYTPRYAPLEQIQDLGTTPQSDIYALGATLYHLLTGVKPPDALTRAAALVSSQPNPLKPANELNPAVDPDLAAILNRAMAQNPNERFASASEFREALRRVGRTGDVEVAAVEIQAQLDESSLETTIVRAREVTQRRLVTPALAAIFLILFAAFGVFCHFYSWNVPPPVTLEVAAAITRGVDSLPQSNGIQTRGQNDFRRRKQKTSRAH